MFGMQAQAQRDCCFQLSNPAADTLHGFANLPGGNLPLSHYMSPLVFGATDAYDMIFSDANCLGIDEGAKVSVELELWCDGENILDGQHDLSRYCNITLQTAYEELHWVGTPMLQENYSFVYEYPGAIPIFSGTYNISNVAFDYFYFRFLTNTNSRIVVTWNQIFRDVQLIVHIRERLNGTDNSLYWNSHVTESEYYQIGGHQSIRGRVLASDTLSPIIPVMKDSVVKDCEPVTVGMPAYTMDTTGIYNIAYVDTSCGYRIDSLIRFDYTHYVHPTTPTLSDSTFTYCQRGTSVPIVLDEEPNDSLRIDHGDQIVPYWSLDGDTFYYADSMTPNTDVTFSGADTILTYYVKRHDNVTTCESDVDTFHVTITRIPDDPQVIDTLVEYCVGETPVALTYVAPAGQQVLWGEDVDNITSTTAPVPTATAAGTKVYYLKLQDTTTVNQCISDGYDSIKVKVYDNPTVTITTDNDTLCFGDKASMQANPATLTTYQWQIDGVDVADSTNTHFSYVNNVTDTTTFKFSVAVTELHVVKSCSAMDSVEVLAYPEIGAPTVVRGDTAICGPGSVTREVANGTHASTSTWYAKDKATVLGTGTTYTQNYTETDTLYVSSSNDFGCETPETNWLRIIVRVDSIPVVTLTADNGGEVCAEENLIIRSSVASAKSPLTYAWTGTGLVAPFNEDSVTFNYATAGVYTDTLTVTDANGCIGDATIDITVDTLPVIVKDVNYTVKNNDYCVGVNGKIEFTTPDYVRYSIDSAATWQTTKVFAPLAAGDYNLVVEDGNGCKNHANHEVIIDAPIMPVLTLTDSANTRCEAPFNGKLIASATPAATYNYQLNDGAFQADSVFSALENGSYTVIVKDMTTGCRDTATHTVTDGRVTPTLTLVQNPNTHCSTPYGGSIAVTAMNPADAVYQYKLVKAVGDTTAYQFDTLFSALNHGLYTVIAKDTATACLGNDTITVQHTMILPTASITASPIICFGDTNRVTLVPGGADVVFVQWDYDGAITHRPDPTVDTLLDKQSFSMKGFPAGGHTFTAHFLDTITHCSDTVSTTIRVVPVNITLKTIPDDAHVCEYDSMKVYCLYLPDDDSDSLRIWNWYARAYSYSTAGKYDTVWVKPSYNNNRISVVVYDNHGCSNSKYLDLKVYQLPALTINTAEQNYCQGATSNVLAIASSTPPYSYEWQKAGSVVGNTNVLAVNVGDTDFDVTLTVTDSNGCVNHDTVDINVIKIPGHPNFDHTPQYFCDNNVNIEYASPAQDDPTVGTFTWLGGLNPENEKTNGTYSAYYVNTENGVSCYSDTTSVDVEITGVPHFSVEVKYNSETTIDTAHVRCFELGAGDTIHVNVTPVAGTVYTFKKNNVAATENMIITRTEAGSYIDTIEIHAVATHGTVQCENDTTIYYYLTINALPTVPDNFPNSYNGGDSTIFYCQGSTASYNFNLGLNQIATYNGSATAPTTAYDNVAMVITDTMTHCSSTFYYDIVEVATPTVKLTSDLADDCSDTLRGKVIATVTPAYDATYERVYTWTPASVEPASPHSKYENTDTVTYTFRAPNDTIVTANVTINVSNGAYSASCVSADSNFIVTFQPAPTKPVMDPSLAVYITADSIAYCDGVTFTITAADFTTSAGATIHMVDGNITESAAIDTVYRVVANNNDAPYCPSDTLKVKVHKKRTPAIPVFDTVYYCAGTQASYTITPLNTEDTITYLNSSMSPLAEQPKTAGVYTLRIVDKSEGCYKDSTLVIVEVALPTATISNSTNWHNDTICEGTTLNEQYVFTITPHVQHTAIETYSWKYAPDSVANTFTLTTTPTADTSVTFFYHLVDTVANSFSHVACAYNFDSTITYTYLAKPAVPYYFGDTLFCAGDSIVIGVDSFSLATTNTELYSTITLPVTYKTTPNIYTFDVQSQYTYYPTCKSTVNTIIIYGYDLPDLSITKTKDTVCFEGDTSTVTASSTTLGTFFVWGADTVASIKVADTLMHYVDAIDDHGCVKKDSAHIAFYPIFTVTVGTDTTVCVDSLASIFGTVTGSTGPFALSWYKDTVITGTELFTATIPSGATDIHDVLADSSAMVDGVIIPTLYKLLVVDNHGCSMSAEENVVEVAATDRPQFIFHKIGDDRYKDIDSMHVQCNNQSGFEMLIQKNCWKRGERVFIDVQVYKHNDSTGVNEPLNPTQLGALMDYYSGTYSFNYQFELTSENAPAIYSVGMNDNNSMGPKHFVPSSKLIAHAPEQYKWFYLHFLDDRIITVRTGKWKDNVSVGTYVFSFAIIKTLPEYGAADIYIPYIGAERIGGYGGHLSSMPLDTIAFDTFMLVVDPGSGSGGQNVDNPTVITTSPEADNDVEKFVNMNVYPNPASNNVNVVLSGVEGQTVITVHDMSGKAVTSMKVDIDDNNQIVNLPVDNFSQGIYFIKAVNGNAVMTKKLIIAR